MAALLELPQNELVLADALDRLQQVRVQGEFEAEARLDRLEELTVGAVLAPHLLGVGLVEAVG